jgi:hypothetical protein
MPHCIPILSKKDSYSASVPDGPPPIIFISTAGNGAECSPSDISPPQSGQQTDEGECVIAFKNN